MSEPEFEQSFEQTMRHPYVTYLLCGLCGGIFLLQMQGGSGTSSGVSFPGYVDGYDLFNGKYWGLLTSFFLHANLMHVAFNVYWLYLFGKGVEPYLGWKRYLLFWFAATAVSSMIQVVVTGDTGVGASGFAYALFGFIWIGSLTHPYLARMLDPQTVVLFVVWLFVCIFLTWTGMDSIGNGAHVGGILYGGFCAYAFLVRREVWWKSAAVAVTVLSFVPLFYAPWLGTWNLAQAEKAYVAQKYERTLSYLDRINLPDYQVYVTELKGDCLSNLGRSSEAAAIYKSLLSLHQESELSDPSYIYNEYAWILATSPDDKLRSPQDAIHYAQLACEKDQYQDSDSLDTLAAAYGSANQFDQAVAWEQKAIAADSDGHDIDEMKAHLKLYQAQKPYIEVPGKSGAGSGT